MEKIIRNVETTNVKADALTSLNSEQVKCFENNNLLIKEINIKTEDQLNDLKKIRSNSSLKLDLTKVTNKLSAMAKLAYIPESLVGLLTVLISNSDVLVNNEYNKQFLIKGSNQIDMTKFKKLFKVNPEKGMERTSYERIFDKNEIIVTDNFGRKQVIVAGFKNSVNVFVENIKNLKSGTQEDLVRIGKDLEIVGRILQEVEIDFAKNPDIKKGMSCLTDIMDTASATKLVSNNIEFDNNLDKLIELKKTAERRNSEYTTEPFSFKVITDELLENVDLDNHHRLQFLKNQEDYINATAEEKEKRESAVKQNIVNDAITLDPSGDIQLKLAGLAENILQRLFENYENSNMDLFNQFAFDPERSLEVDPKFANKSEEDLLLEFKRIIVKAYDMINSCFANSKDISMPKANELASKLRNCIYTAGAARGYEPFDSLCLAINMADKKVDYKNLNSFTTCNFRFKALELMFSTEVKHVLSEMSDINVMAKGVELEIPEGYSVEIDTKLNMVNGSCEIITENGEKDYIYCISDADYTGEILVSLDDNFDVMFEIVEDVFAYEEVDFILFDRLVDTTKENSKTKAETIAIEKQNNNVGQLISSVPTISIKNTNNLKTEYEASKYLDELNKAVKSWNKVTTLVTNNTDAYGVYTLGKYVYCSSRTNGVSIFLGSAMTSHNVEFRRDAETNTNEVILPQGNKEIYTTPVGALVLVK